MNMFSGVVVGLVAEGSGFGYRACEESMLLEPSAWNLDTATESSQPNSKPPTINSEPRTADP